MRDQLALFGGLRVIPKNKRWPIYPKLTLKYRSLLRKLNKAGHWLIICKRLLLINLSPERG